MTTIFDPVYALQCALAEYWLYGAFSYSDDIDTLALAYLNAC